MASQDLSPEVARAIADNDAIKDVLNQMADELAQQELNDQRMLGEVASRINVLKEMEAKARARLDANKKELSLLGQRVHSMCSELPNTLHAVLDNLQKIAETPGSLSEADRAVFAELQHKIDKFIEDISGMQLSQL